MSWRHVFVLIPDVGYGAALECPQQQTVCLLQALEGKGCLKEGGSCCPPCCCLVRPAAAFSIDALLVCWTVGYPN